MQYNTFLIIYFIMLVPLLWQRGGDSRGVAFGRIAAIKIICILAIMTIKKRLNCSGLSLLVIAVQPFF